MWKDGWIELWHDEDVLIATKSMVSRIIALSKSIRWILVSELEG